jgi:leucyl-tRNA---protein transferase
MGNTGQPQEYSDPFPDLFASPCGYFDGLISHYAVFRLPSSEDAFALAAQENPEVMLNLNPKACQQILFDNLLAEGFRRSDKYVYRADCPDCRKCIPIRIAPADFKPSKSQRRILRNNSDITLHITQNPAEFVTAEKLALYGVYDKRHNPDAKKSSAEYKAELMQLNGIHASGLLPAIDGTKSDRLNSAENQKNSAAAQTFCASYSGTLNMEYRLTATGNTPGKLIGTGIIDAGAGSLSSNYFYYDISPETMKRSIGAYSILREIELCRQLRFDWYYLGYWIEDCRKMVYKAGYNPHQLLLNNEWKTVTNK